MPATFAEGSNRLYVPRLHVRRVRERSTPTTRLDNKRIRWILQGGGRGGGIRVAGMLVAAKELGLLPTPDEVDATSASNHSTVVAFAGDPHEGLRHFLSPYYMFRRGRIIDVQALADGIVEAIDPDRLTQDRDLPQIDWHTTSVITGKRRSLPAPTTPSEIHTNLVASSVPPQLGGLTPFKLSDGELVTDNGLEAGSITAPPEAKQVDGPEEVILYLMSDPRGARRRPSRLQRAGALLYDLQGYKKAADLLRTYWERTNRTLDAIDKAEVNSYMPNDEGRRRPKVFVISVPETEPDLSMTGGNHATMVQGARSGYDAFMEVFVPLGLRPRRPSRVPSFGDLFSYARA